MTDYIFQENTLTEKLAFSYEPWLFNEPAYLAIQSQEWNTFSLYNEKHKTVKAQLHVNIQQEIAVSPLRAPFGSVQFSPSLKPKMLFDFLEFVCQRLKEKGITQLILKNPPDAYESSSSSLLNSFLFNLRFDVETAEVGAVLSTGKPFVENLNAWEMRKLRQAEKEGLSFGKLDPNQLEFIFQFILACRKERDYSLSIDWNTIVTTVKIFPDRFILFSVTHHGNLVAASICINVGNNILYNFHSAHPREHDHLSPVVLLLKGIHQFCVDNNYRLLDLGTSALDGLPNFGLLDFKLGLGAQPTMKLTFKKEL